MSTNLKAHNNKGDLKVLELLDLCDTIGIRQITGEARSFGDIEYALSCDDKDFTTFHKEKDSPYICHKLEVCDYETTKEPVYKDWYMTINYHS